MRQWLAAPVGMLPFLVVCLAGCPPSEPKTLYSVTDLGSFGGWRSNALAVSDKGQVVGLSELPSGVVNGFLWDEATGIHSVGSLHRHSEAWDINELGQIVGESDTPGGGLHPFLWQPDTPNGTSGTMYDLGSFGGEGGAWQINESGLVSGGCELPDGQANHPFLWRPYDPNGTDGEMTDLGTLGGPDADARAINDFGQTAGRSWVPLLPNRFRTFVWTPHAASIAAGTMLELNTFPLGNAFARGINNSGEVVGAAWLSDEITTRAFKWTPDNPNAPTGGHARDLGTLGGGSSYAHGINDRGDVVGQCTTSSGVQTAFLWTQAEGMIDLSASLASAYRYDSGTGKGRRVLMARDINANGWIVGTGSLDDGQPRAVLLRPIEQDD
jgi:probable HAF family extracellular repeat protein